MTESVQYKKPRKINIVVIILVLVLVTIGYAIWTYLPAYMRKSEVTRVLDEVSSVYTGQASRMLADDNEVDKLLRKMRSDIQVAGVNDPEAEYWIEIDDDNTVRFGVLYSDFIRMPFGENKEVLQEIEMTCSRAARGSGWSCEVIDLQSDPNQGDLDVQEAP